MAKRPGGPPRPQTRIALDCQPARAIGGGQFECLTTAVVTDGNRAMAGLKIQFYANSAVVGGEVTTDPNGRTTQALRFAGTAGRSVNVEAQVVGGSIRSSATITLPDAPQAPITDKLSVVKSTDPNNGRHIISVGIADQKNNPKGGVAVGLLLNGARINGRTDPDGFAIFRDLDHGDAVVDVLGFDRVHQELERIRPPVRLPQGTPFWRGLGFRLAHDNNTRLKAGWIFIGVFFLINAFIFVFGSNDISYQPSQEKRNLYSVYENVSGIAIAPAVAKPESDTNSVCWKIWCVCFVIGLIYIPIALSDEVGRAINTARRMAMERKSQQNLPDPKQPTQPDGQTGRGLTKRFAVVSDFLTAMAAETFGRWVSGRR